MWQEIVSRYENKYGPSSMMRVKGLLYETPGDRERRDPRQSGARYLLPGLSTDVVLEIDRYPELKLASDRFREKHPSIRREISDYLAKVGRPEEHAQYAKVGRAQWKYVFLNRLGKDEAAVAPYFPETMAYIEGCASILFPVAGIAFSVLEPGGYIGRHCDRTNVFIHMHQGVVTPPDCGLKVGDREITFEEARSHLFDPSFFHEAWNRSPLDRIQLILPVWHPETTLPEREALVEVFRLLRDLTEASSARAAS